MNTKKHFGFRTSLNKKDYDVNDVDEWGVAYLNVIGTGNSVEYNICKEDRVDYSAIYKVVYDAKSDEWKTDYSTFVEYHINFNDKNWKKALRLNMIKVAKEMFNIR